MSSASEHHEEAERLLALARIEQDGTRRGLILAEAQVHATLALSAAPGTSPPSPGQAQTGSTASTGEARPVVPEGSADFPMLPHVPPRERISGRRYPPGEDPRRRTEERRVSARAAPPPVPASPHSPEPSPPIPAHPSPRRPPEEQPREQEPGPAGQSPVPGNPGDQEPGGPAPSM